MTPLDRDRLAKVLAMLASPHPGEVHAAAQAAARFLNAADTSWHELLAIKEPQPQELLEAKIHVLQDSNRRLRYENHQLRIQAGRIRDGNEFGVRLFVAWMASVFLIGFFVFIAIK
jgi:CHAD domain-containing protein